MQNKQLSMSQCRALVQTTKRQLAESHARLESWQAYAARLEAVLKARIQRFEVWLIVLFLLCCRVALLGCSVRWLFFLLGVKTPEVAAIAIACRRAREQEQSRKEYKQNQLLLYHCVCLYAGEGAQ
jgi:hypothetical protein